MNLVIGLFSWGRLPMMAALLLIGIVALVIDRSPSPAYAYASSLEIECRDSAVTEGDAFTLDIVNGQSNTNNPQTMKVFWYTIPDTADEADFSSLHGEEQTSSESETDDKRMQRSFQTTEDEYSEVTESYSVRALNAESNGTGAGTCTIEIEDDDGAGATKTWIDSHPGGQSQDSADGSITHGYRLGDKIRIKQKFTENVTKQSGSLTLGLNIGTADDYVRREATYKQGTGTNTLTFEYEVVESDFDPDGIVIPGSDYGGDGSLVTTEGSNTVNAIYQGSVEGTGQTVYGGPYVEVLSVSSTPAVGETYRFGEAIEIKAKFNRSVTVDGSPTLRMLIGEGDDHWVDAAYSSGSGTDSLFFRHVVVAKDSDSSGVSVERGYIDGDGDIHGIASGGYVTRQSEDYVIYPFYNSLQDQSGHKVDGKPYVTGIEVTSTPASGQSYGIGEEIKFTVTFDQNLSLDPPLGIPLNIGDGFDTNTYLASYDSDSQDNTIVFTHRVSDHQRDDDGISISAGNRILDSGTVYAEGTSVEAYRDIPELPDQAGHKVYAFLPAVSSNSVTSSPTAGDTYRAGETIEVSLTFYFDVEVSGTPTIRILVGDTGNQRNAAYSSGSGTDTLVFAYEVEPADLDSDGVAIMARVSGGFESGGHVNQEGTTNRSRGRIPGLGSQSGHKVDGRPYVTAVAVDSSPAGGGVYRAGETIEISLSFDQAVDVDETPSIQLKLGDEEMDAAYNSGTGTDTLVFEYEVQDADEDANGVSLTAKGSDGFGGSGGIVAAGTEVAAHETIPGLDNLTGHAVDGQVDVVSVTVASQPGDDETYEKKDIIEFLVEFEDEVTVSGSPQLAIAIGSETRKAGFQGLQDSSEGSEGTTSTNSASSSATGKVLEFSYTVQEGDDDDDGISIAQDSLGLNGGSIVDAAGNNASLSHDAVATEGHLVGAVPPVFESARTSAGGSEVTVTFSEDVDVSSQLRTLSSFGGVDVGVFLRVLFDVFVGGHRVHTTGASISGSDLTLTLDTEIAQGQAVTVSYDNLFTQDVSDMIVDGADNPLANFTGETVDNRSTVTGDEDAIWPTISAHSVTLAAGSTGTYTVALGSQPDADVTVSLTVSPAGDLTASPTTLTFTTGNWDTAQTVTLTAASGVNGQNSWQEIIHTSDTDGFVSGHVKVLVEE